MDGTGKYQAFVVSETNGVWGADEDVPGLASLNAGGEAIVFAMSCTSASDCSAGGVYSTQNGNFQAFVVNEVSGTWQTAVQVPGIAAIEDNYSRTTSLACGSPGNCVAGGYYYVSLTETEAFVADEVNGTWENAVQVPGTSALNAGFHAQTLSVACASAGNCSAGGYLEDSSGADQAFVASESGGVWSDAIEVPGIAALNKGIDAGVKSISCPSADECVAGGYYLDSSGSYDTFVVSQSSGIWDTAMKIPGSAILRDSDHTFSLSCAAVGNCSAGGSRFVVSEVNGTWGTALEVPGFASFPNGFAEVSSVSCATAGNCSAGGMYTAQSSSPAFVIDEVDGTWQTFQDVPGVTSLNVGGFAATNAVSCPPGGTCSAGGYYSDSSNFQQAFVADQEQGSATALDLSAATAVYGSEQAVRASVTVSAGSEPAGTVTVKAAGKKLCVITLTGGAGSCVLSATALPADSYHLVASYGGDLRVGPSSSPPQALIVSKAPSTTTASLAIRKVTYGNEQAARISVTVYAAGTTPGGTATIHAASSTLCTVMLTDGTGSCIPAATALPIGSYQVTASYPGTTNIAPSVSQPEPLTVSQSASCPTVLAVGLHGMGEGPSPTIKTVSPTILDTFNAFESAAKELGKKGENLDPFAYDTISIKAFATLKGIRKIVMAVGQAATDLDVDLKAFAQICPSSPVSLVGYSMGAWIINDFITSYKTDASQIKSVALYGDPCWYSQSGTGTYQGLARRASDEGCMPQASYPLPNSKSKIVIQSFCISKDPVCGRGFKSTDTQIAAAKKCGTSNCPHFDYTKGYPRTGDTVAGGQFLAKHAF